MAEQPRTTEMHIDVHTMRYLVALANEGSMRKAANSLHVTQPTLSRQLGQLERSAGKQLFERKGGRMRLTQDGMLLLRYAKEIVELADRAAEELSEEGGRVAGRVVIGCAETISLEFVAACIRKTCVDYPGVTVDCVTGSPLEMFERLDSGVLDFLVEVTHTTRAGFESLQLPGENEWCLLVPSDDELAQKQAITPDDLRGKPFVCSRLAWKSGVIEQWAGDVAQEFVSSATFNLGTYLATALAANKVGYTLTYETLSGIVNDPRLVRKPLDPPIEPDRNMLTWKKGRMLNSACAAFFDVLRDAIADEGRVGDGMRNDM